MYVVKSINESESRTLYDANDGETLLSHAEIEESINKTGSLKIGIPVTNRGAANIYPLRSEIVVEDMDGVEIYRGRPVKSESDIYGTTEYECEGVMAYLLDTQYPPYVHTGAVSLFLESLLNYHNKRVPDKQKIYLGNVTVVDPNDYIRRESENYEAVLNIIQEKLVSSFGGLLRIRRVNNKNYLDYLADYPISDQVARIGENIVDLTKCIDTDTVRTVIIPLGAQDDDGKYLDISSVNGGKNYLVDHDLVALYGWIEGVVEFEDVTVAENLLKKGQEYLEQCRNFDVSVELSMVDCRLIGLDTRRLHPGMQVKVEADFHSINQYFLCVSKTTDLLNPANDVITLGSQFKTFTETVNKDKKEYISKVENVKTTLSDEIQDAKDDFKEEIENASGLYKTEVKQSDGSTVTYYHDKKKLEDSMIQMVFNSAGFGMSADGGKTWYGMQVDGDMIANILNVHGINAEWIRTGVIYSVDYQEGVKGTMYNLNTSEIVSYYTSPYDGHHYKALLTHGSLEFFDLDEPNNSTRVLLNHMSLSEGTHGNNSVLTPSGLQVSELKSNGSVEGKVFVTKNGIEMRDGTTITFPDGNTYSTGKTGRAEFSDGSYLMFKNGVLIGGQTSDGGSVG